MGLVRMCCVFLFCMSIIISPIQSLSTARIFQIFQSAPRSKSLSTRLSMNLDGKLSSPPRTFIECARQAASAAKAAIESGEMLLEVEFPPLPVDYLEDSSSSARDVADANSRWAIEFAKTFTERGQVSIIYPDQPELDDAIKYVDSPGGAQPFPNVTLATIRSDSIKNARSIDQVIASIFGATLGGTVETVPNTSLYVALVSSTQELTDLQKLHNLDPTVPLVFFNLRLDTLRGDLGLPLFPGRDLHYNFLAKIRPAFIISNKAYSTSLIRPPFVINYSGMLFRTFPEPFQCILNTGNGKTKLVKVVTERPSNAEFREALTGGLVIPGVPKDELKTKMDTVWWEKDLSKEQFSAWRL